MTDIKEAKVSDNFKLKEFIADETLDNIIEMSNRLEKFRESFGKPITVNYPGADRRGLRTYNQNIAVGGSERSFHLEGAAVDMSWSAFIQADPRAHAILKKLFKGIIWYPAHVHVDLRDYEFIDFNGKYK